MNEKPNDGGPAFPYYDIENEHQITGMSLRDYFAAKAIQGALANNELLERLQKYAGDNPLRAVVAAFAYGVADTAMLQREDAKMPPAKIIE